MKFWNSVSSYFNDVLWCGVVSTEGKEGCGYFGGGEIGLMNSRVRSMCLNYPNISYYI